VKRIALLIGNKDYKPGVGALQNPLKNVRVAGEALKTVGLDAEARSEHDGCRHADRHRRIVVLGAVSLSF